MGLKRSPLQRYSAAIVAIFLLSLAATVLLYKNFVAVLSVDWPAVVFSHESVIGGKTQNLKEGRDSIRVYVCTDTSEGQKCWRQIHAEGPTFGRTSWHAFTRFGNESPETNFGGNRIAFSVVAAAGEGEFDSSISTPFRGTPEQLRRQLSSLAQVAVVGETLKIERMVRQRSPFSFTRIETRSPPKNHPIPPLRLPVYGVCPPLTLHWTSAQAPMLAAFVEVHHDAAAVPPVMGPLNSFHIAKWPDKVELVEVKISAAPGKGPYDNIYLRRQCGISSTADN